MKKLFVVATGCLLILLASVASAADQARDLTIVTGEHWVGSSLEQKRAFLFGVGNMLELEQAMAGDSYEAMRGRSIVPVLLEGLSGTPLNNIVKQLDKFYADNPRQRQRSVIEVLYIEMALPNLSK